MRSVVRRRILRGSALAVVVGVFAVLFISSGLKSGPNEARKGGGGLGLGLAASSPSFTIEGNATEPISPGVSSSLNLKLTNPNGVAVSISHLVVTLRAVKAPKADQTLACSVGDFTVQQASTSQKITLAPRSTSTLASLGLVRATWPQVGMLDRSVDQDGCKGASLALDYTASGAAGEQ